MLSWDIVLFREENNVEYVPSSWACNAGKTMYLWPKKMKNTQIRKLIDECLEPSPNIPFSEISGEFKKSVNSIELAKELVNIVCMTSNIESSGAESMDNAPSASSSTIVFEHESSDDEIVGIAKRKRTMSNKSNDSNSQALSTPSNKNDYFPRKVFHYLEKIEYELKAIKKETQKNTVILSRILNEHPTASARNQNIFKLPLTDSKMVADIEEMLTADNARVDELAVDLSLVGGESLRTNVNLIMKRLMGKELSLEYSAKGKGGKKKCFSALNIYQSVIKAVRRRFDHGTEVEILKYIGFSLATTADRDGGRKSRITKTTQQIADEN